MKKILLFLAVCIIICAALSGCVDHGENAAGDDSDVDGAVGSHTSDSNTDTASVPGETNGTGDTPETSSSPDDTKESAEPIGGDVSEETNGISDTPETSASPDDTKESAEPIGVVTPEEIIEGCLHPDPLSPFSLLSEDNITGYDYADKDAFQAWFKNSRPGEVPPADMITKADQGIVGTERQIRFDKREDFIPFAYIYDRASKKERLALFIYYYDKLVVKLPPKYSNGIPMFVICETELGGLEGLCRVIESGEPFGIKVLAAANYYIDVHESFARSIPDLQRQGDIIIDTSAPEHIECDVIRLFGAVGIMPCGEDQAVTVYANLKEEDRIRRSTFYIMRDWIRYYGCDEYMQP